MATDLRASVCLVLIICRQKQTVINRVYHLEEGEDLQKIKKCGAKIKNKCLIISYLN